MTLKELYHSKGYGYYPTDKDRNHNYLTTYSELLGKWENDNINILEVGCYKNGSLKLFEEYFKNANIIGYDIKAYDGATDVTRPTIFFEDFYNSSKDLPKLHIAIDDGDHSIESQLAFVRKVYPRMAAGGILIVEDVMPGHKADFDSLGIPYTEVSFYPPTDQEDDRIIIIRK